MGLLSECQNIFDTEDLYEVLQVKKSAKKNELKKSYYKASLKYHPDRVDTKNKEEATIKFQVLGKVYSILSDEDKRAVYDETGEVDDEDLPEEKNWDQYWRLLFPKITEADIKNFENDYKGSEEELVDLKKAYLEGEGSIDFILENLLCASVDDVERLEKIIRRWIKKGEVEDFPNFSGEKKKQKDARKRKAEIEAAEAEMTRAELGLDDSERSLRQLMLKRSEERAVKMDSFLDNLASKYATKSDQNNKKGKKTKKK